MCRGQKKTHALLCKTFIKSFRYLILQCLEVVSKTVVPCAHLHACLQMHVQRPEGTGVLCYSLPVLLREGLSLNLGMVRVSSRLQCSSEREGSVNKMSRAGRAPSLARMETNPTCRRVDCERQAEEESPWACRAACQLCRELRAVAALPVTPEQTHCFAKVDFGTFVTLVCTGSLSGMNMCMLHLPRKSLSYVKS